MKKFVNVKLPKVGKVLQIEDYQFHDRVANGVFIAALISILVLVGVVFKVMGELPPEIPFLLSRTAQGERLASTESLWIIVGGLVVGYLVNYALALVVQKQYLLLARMIGVVTLILVFIASFVVWNLINLVI